LKIGLLISGAILLVGVMILFGWLTKRELDKIIKEEEELQKLKNNEGNSGA
jgi:hypothetical protein